jgi:hypothetical protein
MMSQMNRNKNGMSQGHHTHLHQTGIDPEMARLEVGSVSDTGA